MENVIERALIYAKDRPIEVDDLPEYLQAADARPLAENAGPEVMFTGLTIKEMEKKMILAALQRCPSKAQAARELGISVRKIEYLVKDWAKNS